jgi:hypothetical protein
MTGQYMTESELCDLSRQIRKELISVKQDTWRADWLRLQMKLVDVKLSILTSVCKN